MEPKPIDIQRLRNLTTGILHTKMEDIYEDIEYITSASGIMTHMLPNARQALLPYLKRELTEPRFWDDKYDTTHVGFVYINPMVDSELDEFWKIYSKLPSPLAKFAG